MKAIFPILDSLTDYTKSTFHADLMAGITVAIMLVPQGMAYALLAGLPPIYGLYGGLIPLFIYALLGTSRQMSIGPVAISALLIVAGVGTLAEPNTPAYIELVLLAGLLIGIMQLLLSFLRMGFLVNFLSHPVIAGFTSAAAIIIAISQLKDLLGIAIPRMEESYETLFYALEHLGQSNWIAIAMCLGSIFIMSIIRKFSKSFPSALFVVVLGTLLTWFFELQNHGINIVGTVPEGLPSFGMPSIRLDQIKLLLPTVITVTIIGVVESISIAKVLESKHQDYLVNPNQELLALGFSKIIGSFFQALPTSGSFSRSAVNNDSGAKTNVASLVTAALIALTLLWLIPLFYYLPKAVLAAIILLAVKGLFDIKEAIHLWKTHKQDFAMLLVTFVITLILGIEEGVLTGVVLSIAMVLYRSSAPHIVELGNLPGTTSYRNVERFGIEPAADILVLRFDDQLYFANTAYFKETIQAFVKEKGEALEALILDSASIHEVDSSGLHALEEIHDYLKNKNIEFYMTGVIGPVRDALFKTGLIYKFGEDYQFLKNHDAILYHQTKDDHTVETKGWKEEALQTNIAEEE